MQVHSVTLLCLIVMEIYVGQTSDIFRAQQNIFHQLDEKKMDSNNLSV